MSNRIKHSIAGFIVSAIAAIALTSCGGTGDSAATADLARTQAKAAWKLSVADAGATSEMSLERMDIYLTEDEYPEYFEIRGDGVVLVGEIPQDLKVGYDEAFDKLIGKAIPLKAHGGDPREEKDSFVTINGLAYPVSGGSFTVQKVTGKWSGSEGDKTVHCTVELKLPSANGDRTVTGTFAVNAVTWG
jgi:hypothetical protein